MPSGGSHDTVFNSTPAGSSGPGAPGKEIPWLEPNRNIDQTPATSRGRGRNSCHFVLPERANRMEYFPDILPPR
jgi:hypothetical protein